VVEFKTVHFCS